MLRKIRRPSPAMVIAMVALFAALGGTAVAAKTLTKKNVKNISNNQITNRAPGLSVSHASTADTATNATNATHATTADALSSPTSTGVQPFKFFAQANGAATILSVQGAVFEGACDAAGNLSFAATRIRGTADNGIAKVAGVSEGQNAYNNSNDDLDSGETVALLRAPGATGADREVGATADYMGNGGNPNVSVNYASEESSALAVGASCVLFGTAQTP